MQKKTQIELTRRVLAFVDARSTEMCEAPYPNPVSDYASAEQAGLERDLLFRREPIFLALSCQLPRAGDYITADIAGTPVLAVRGEAGDVRAFLNVCRHRGTQIASGCGSGARTFVCPYHGWTYDLSGKLRRLTPAAGFAGLEGNDHNLVRLPAVERDGVIWAKASAGGSIDPEVHLGGLADELRSYGLQHYTHFETQTVRRQMNWKLVVDTFLETWHVGTLHRTTVAPIFIAGVNVFDAFGRNGRLIIPRHEVLECRNLPEPEWDLLKHSAIVYQIFPNTLFVWQRDHVEVWKAFPAGDGVNECFAQASLFSPEPALTESAKRYWARNMDLLMRTVNEEDFPACEGIQRGLRSGAQTHLTFGRNEPGLTHYHRTLRRAVGLPAVAPLPLKAEADTSDG